MKISKEEKELTLKDYFLTGEEFNLIKNAEFGFLETIPKPDDLFKYYQSENYISHTDASKTLFEKLYQEIKKINNRIKFSKLEGFKAGMSILDVGCGSGDFLQYAQSHQADVLGFEPNQKAREFAEKKLGSNHITQVELSELNSSYDFITLWHVLEHVEELNSTIVELGRLLKPNGKLYLALPNYNSYDARFYKNHWAGYDVPRHLWHFNPESVELLFNSFGMKIEKKLPMWFDSYYVSVLSENYKKSNFGVIRAFLIGSISNLQGFFTGNTSSIIYQIKKTD